MVNQTVLNRVQSLKKAAKDNDAPIWSRLVELSLKKSSARRTVNLNKIDSLTKDGDSVIVPGKVLGTGQMTHGITLYSFSISKNAADKIISSGGKVSSLEGMVSSNPTGKGVALVG